jgi:hypothetical protein
MARILLVGNHFLYYIAFTDSKEYQPGSTLAIVLLLGSEVGL